MNKINNFFSIIVKSIKSGFNAFLDIFRSVPDTDPHASPEDTKPRLSWPRLFLFFMISILAGYYLFILSPEFDKKKKSEESNNVIAVQKPIPVENPFDKVSVQARSAYVLDVKNNKVLFSKNETVLHPLASLTKVMTALTASDILPTDSITSISMEAVSQEGDNGLFLGELWKTKDLIDFTLVVSSNDGAYALAQKSESVLNQSQNPESFVKKMNDMAREIGLEKTFFNNVTGLDYDKETAGGYGSAKDMTNLFLFILKNNPNLLEATKYGSVSLKSENGITHTIKNTDPAVNQMPAIIGSKTGFTDLAQGNVVLAFDAGIDYPIIISILGSTYDGRFDDVEKLIKAALDYYGINFE